MMISLVKRYGMSVVTALLIFVTSIGPAYANLFGSDNFNDNTVDTSKWGSDYVYGGGILTETNSRLEFTVPIISTDPGGWSGVERPWILNHGSYIESWAVQLDVGVGSISVPSGPNNYAAMALSIENADDPRDGALIELAVGNLGRDFLANFFNNQAFVGPSVYTGTTSEAAALQIAFDSINKLLLLQYDSNGPVGGYNWTTLRTENIGLWNMTDTSVFNVMLNAGSGGVVLTSGMVTADNFLASPVPEPATLLLLGLGLVGLGGVRKKFRK
jgi:hypothetical protein